MNAQLIDWIILVATAIIAYHGLTYRDEEGEQPLVHLLFGCIALLFFLRILFVDILNLI